MSGELALAIAALCFLGGSDPVWTSTQKAQRLCQRQFAVCMQKKPAKKESEEWLLNCVIEKETTEK